MFSKISDRGVSVYVGAALLLAMVSFSPPAGADVEWRSGAVSVPVPMQPGEMAQAISSLAARPEERRVVMHFDGPLRISQREALEANGVRLLSYLGGYAYFVTLTPGVDAAKVATLSGPLAVEPIDPVNKMHPDLASGIVRPWSVIPGGDRLASSPTVAIYVMFHRDFDLGQAEGLIGRYAGSVQSKLEAINSVTAHLPMERVADLAASDDVMYVEPPLPQLTTLNDENRSRTQSDVVNAAPYGLDGSGVTVMVYDGGGVFSHNDLAGRLTSGDSDGISDHATHVACTIAGNDSGGSFSGMAPNADIVSYGFEVPGGLEPGFLYFEPGDLEADYTDAFVNQGADLSNNSIGSNTAVNGFPCEWEGNYGVTGALIDEVVRGAVFGFPARVVWANGNERNTSNCGQLYYTTGPPACGKNHMTVGALNSNDDSITGFTSWGPCDDGRLKPDISAPGCQSGGDGGVTSCSSSGGYSVKCGTSMASPTAAGVTALLLEQYRLSHPTLPDFRNSLLRSIMAQTAVDLGNPGPDHQSGYGSIRAQPAADLIIEGRFIEDSVVQDEVYAFSMDVGAGEEVKVTMAWDDPAGTPDVNPNLVNDLDLTIVGPDQTVYLPWTLDPANPGDPAVKTQRDGTNNIEQVHIASASPGTYRVEITGFNIAEEPEQPFGVATSHPLTFCELTPTFGGLQGIAPGDSCGEIDLSWSAGSSNCDPAGDITYNVYRGSGPFAPLDSPPVHVGVAGTTFTDFGLEPGQQYMYVVRANDSASGEDTNSTELTETAPAEPDIAAPVFAGLLTAEAGPACGEIVLDWEPAIESCSRPVQYEIYRAVGGFWPPLETLVGTTFTTDFVDTSVPAGTNFAYRVRARDSLGNLDGNSVQRSVTAPVFDIEAFYTGFEPTNEGWTVIAPNDSTTGEWEWGDPEGTSYQPEDDDTEPGVNCWITGLSGDPGNGDVDDGSTTLLSSLYDMTGMVNPTVTYSRWFTNDQGGSPGDPTDDLRVDVSNDDGQNWTSLETVGEGTPLAWVPVEIALPVAATDEMRFRFSTADLGSGSLVEAGIDEFRLVDEGQACLACTEAPPSTLCTISVERSGSDDILVDWSSNPVGTRAVVYQINGCGTLQRVKLGTSDGNTFLHEDAVLSTQPFNYRVTFVDECGNEVAFCGATDCP